MLPHMPTRQDVTELRPWHREWKCVSIGGRVRVLTQKFVEPFRYSCNLGEYRDCNI